jgi:lactoylglutathione lyase
MTKLTGIPTVGVPVKDQAKALEFFTGTLGLETRRDVEIANFGRWLWPVRSPGWPGWVH